MTEPTDLDRIETQEWLYSLRYVLEERGPERAAALLECDDDADALAQSILRALEALGPTHISYLGDHTRPGRGHPTPQRRLRTPARRQPLQHPQLAGFANRL